MPLVASSKRTIRARLALILALAMSVISLSAVSAQATQVEWLNTLLGAHKWAYSEGLTITHLLSSTVYYTGSGTVSVCEQVYDESTASWISSKCGNQFAEATPGEVEPHLGQSMQLYGENNTSFAHTIHGVYVH